MKKVASALIMVVFAASAAMAAAGPEMVTMKAKNGDVTFNHKKHAAGDCKLCHGEGTPAKVSLDKAAAHKLCIDCHKAQSGPTKCGECHKK